MIIELTYGESGVEKLDTAFSLSFLQKLIEKELITKDFLKAIAVGTSIPESFDDFYNLPYCCYINNNIDPMSKDEFEQRFILNIPLLKKLYFAVMLGDQQDSTMKNMFKVREKK